jgi:hypothetical protein
MPYSLAQILLTVLFNFVAVFGFFFVLIACAAEASQRQFQCQSNRTQFYDRFTTRPATDTMRLTLSHL